MSEGVYRDGHWQQGAGEPLVSTDPVTGEVVFEAGSASPADVQASVDAARAAFPAWAGLARAERIAILQRYGEALKARAPAIAETISRDTGKPLWESTGEAAAMVGKIAISVDFYNRRTGVEEAPVAFGRTTLDHKPWGVMAVLGPFNFPGHLPNGHIVPALLAGNTVVFKPSELAPAVAKLMVAAFEEAGLPPGVLNVVHGARETGAALLTSSGIDGVLFTGSATTGTMIHKMFGGRPEVVLALEMGGNNPLIVWDPADITAAADLIVHSTFITSGQRCSCARRIILPEGSWGDGVLDAVRAKVERMVIGPWNATPEPFIGPVIHARQAALTAATQRHWIELGGKPLFEAVIGVEGPAFVRPGLIDMSAASGVEDDELFAPLAQVWRVASFEEAIARANATRFGLSAGLVSDDPALWELASARLRAGLVNRNRPTTGAASSLPFGGPGLSGNGRPSAAYAADYAAWPVARQEADTACPISAPGLS
jgi:succinylglutamic semialdehyde dehydrogenase